MVPTPPDAPEGKSGRSDQYLLTLRSFVLFLVCGGVVLLWVHNPRWGAAVLGGITALAIMARMIR
jgi:hypothetical protein